MSHRDELRERLIDHLTRIYVPKVTPVNGVVNISAENMADALLPFILDEITAAQQTDQKPPTDT